MDTEIKNIQGYIKWLHEGEKSEATCQKYERDIRAFMRFVCNEVITKDIVIAYKEKIKKEYKNSSVNSMLASINSFLAFIGRSDLKVKQLKTQKQIFCSEEKELSRDEYLRLVEAARKLRNERIGLVIQTICATGIRVSELPFITVEAAKCGEAAVCLKGKNRIVLLTGKLKKRLQEYIRKHKIMGGPIFVTRNGNPLNRSNIWRDMKKLCESARVDEKKVFPHNLRHLFARCFYSLEKDIAKLADILGHSSIDTTRLYIISTGKEHRRQLEALRLVS